MENHPLPSPPGTQDRTGQGRSRAKSSAFSLHSRKSSGSGQKAEKLDLQESHNEKESLRLHGKADPSMAITELEPSAVANQAATLASIRAIQHKDALGNPITDPDRSNPTRWKLERPLDTIRSFEAAINEKYYSRGSRTESDVGSTYNRRSSYFAGTDVTNNDERARYSQHSYYNSSPQGNRPNNGFEGRGNGMQRPNSYYTGNNAIDNSGGPGPGPNNGYQPNRNRYPRTASEPHFNPGGNGVYPNPGVQHSYETVTTASGVSADPAGYSTDPSSENSSVDRIHTMPQKQPMETYGIGFGNTPEFVPPGSALNEQYMSNGQQRRQIPYQNQAPVPPQKENARVPISLGPKANIVTTIDQQPTRPAQQEKRRSWFGRRLSKNK